LLYVPILSILSAILDRPAVARIARFVVPGLPHHVTTGAKASSSGTTMTAFTAICCGRLATRRASTSFANCLTPNHVHLILTPATADGLARALGKAPHGRGLLRVRIGVRTGPA